jgi:hypothetical protein
MRRPLHFAAISLASNVVGFAAQEAYAQEVYAQEVYFYSLRVYVRQVRVSNNLCVSLWPYGPSPACGPTGETFYLGGWASSILLPTV